MRASSIVLLYVTGWICLTAEGCGRREGLLPGADLDSAPADKRVIGVRIRLNDAARQQHLVNLQVKVRIEP